MTQVYLLAAALLVLTTSACVLAAWLFSSKKFKTLLAWIPLCLLAAASTFWTIDSMAGWPSSKMPSTFIPISYVTDGKVIHLWGMEKGTKVPRNFVQPYSKELHEQLEKAKQSAAKGSPMQLERGGKSEEGKAAGGEQSKGEWRLYDLRPAGPLPPKDGYN